MYRHEIFPEFSGIPEFYRPQRSFSWKSQIRCNIYGGGGGGVVGTINCGTLKQLQYTGIGYIVRVD